jgi:hypothetical protein
VGVGFDAVAVFIVGVVEVEFGAGLAEFASELGCGEDGDRENLACFEQLLGRGDYFGEFVDGGAEFVLQIADAGRVDFVLAREGREAEWLSCAGL